MAIDCSNTDIESNNILKKLDTPCYIIDESHLDFNINDLVKSFTNIWSSNVIFGYSVKTNSLPWIVTHMKKRGFLAEVVSEQEYKLVRKLGFEAENILLNGPNKGEEILIEALNHGVYVNIDNFEEIESICRNIDKRQRIWRVGLRYNFHLEKYCPGETIVGDELSRFGFNIENGDIYKAIDLLKSLDGIKVIGLHGHSSTKAKSTRIFSTIAEKAAEIIEKGKLDLEYIDIGGGFFGDKPSAPSYLEYATTIKNGLSPYDDLCLILEPGASLVSSPIQYVTKVVNTRINGTTRFVTTDGSNIHINPMMHNIRFSTEVISNSSWNASKSASTYMKQIICGFTCIEMDRLAETSKDVVINVGDLIKFNNCGSYSMALSPLFIGYFPSVYVIRDNKAINVRESWTECEFVQKCEVDL